MAWQVYESSVTSWGYFLADITYMASGGIDVERRYPLLSSNRTLLPCDYVTLAEALILVDQFNIRDYGCVLDQFNIRDYGCVLEDSVDV